MNSEFAEYLEKNRSRKVGAKSLFKPATKIISHDEIVAAEKLLNCSLPFEYTTFVKTLGAGTWADSEITAPQDLYAFDESTGEMSGFIAIAGNVDGCGNYVAFNPEDRKLYFCCHDPFGCAAIADSFEEFIDLITIAWSTNPDRGTQDFFAWQCTSQIDSP